MLRRILAPTRQKIFVFSIFIAFFTYYVYNTPDACVSFFLQNIFLCETTKYLFLPAFLLSGNGAQFGFEKYALAPLIIAYLFIYYEVSSVLVEFVKYMRSDEKRKKILLVLSLLIVGLFLYGLYGVGNNFKTMMSSRANADVQALLKNNCTSTEYAVSDLVCFVLEDLKSEGELADRKIKEENSLLLGALIASDKIHKYYPEAYGGLRTVALTGAAWAHTQLLLSRFNITLNMTIKEVDENKKFGEYLVCLETEMDACWLNIEKKVTPDELNNKKQEVDTARYGVVSEPYLGEYLLTFGKNNYLRFGEELRMGNYLHAAYRANEVIVTGWIIEDSLNPPEKMCVATC